jgi:hypothetical protein
MGITGDRPDKLNAELPKEKWSSEAGPRQTKDVNEAFRAIIAEGRTYTEKTGVRNADGSGGDSFTFTQLMGPIRQEAADLLAKLGRDFGWKVTRENYRKIIEAAGNGIAELKLSRPVHDKRQTAEEDAAEQVEINEQRAAYEKAAEDRKALIESHYQEHLHDFDAFLQKQRPGESTHAWTGRTIRAELALAFPGVTFRVKTDYNSVDVYWSLGPTEHRIRELLQKYERWEHEGTDSEELRKKRAEHEAILRIVGGYRFCFPHREIPYEVTEEVAKLMCAMKGIEYTGIRQPGFVDGDHADLGDHVHRLTYNTDWPEGGKPIKVEFNPDYQGGPRSTEWRIVFEQVAPTATPCPSSTAGGITIRRNPEHDGVEISFPSKPAPDVLARVKGAGFRWSMRGKVWYKKYTPEAWRSAHALVGIPEAGPVPETSPSPDRFDMRVEDNMARACGLI